MGKAERFYGNPFCFLAHMTGRHSPERGRISNQNNKSTASTPVCGAGTRNWRLPQSLRAHTEPLDCQAADSTAAILWRKKKKPVAVQRTAGFPSKRGQIKTVSSTFTPTSQIFILHRGRGGRKKTVESAQLYSSFALRSFFFFFFTASARSSAPCSTNMARQHRLRSSWNAHWITHISSAQQPTPVTNSRSAERHYCRHALCQQAAFTNPVLTNPMSAHECNLWQSTVIPISPIFTGHLATVLSFHKAKQ